MSESKEFKSEQQIPEERFQPKTPREEKIFNQARDRWYEEEWLRIIEEVDKDKFLSDEYREFLSESIKREIVEGKKEVPAVERESHVTGKDKIEKTSEEAGLDEWSIDNIIKLNKTDPGAATKIMLGLIIVLRELEGYLEFENKNEEAKKIRTETNQLIDEYNEKKFPKEGFLIMLYDYAISLNVSEELLNKIRLGELAKEKFFSK